MLFPILLYPSNPQTFSTLLTIRPFEEQKLERTELCLDFPRWHVHPLSLCGSEHTAQLNCAKRKVRETQEDKHKWNKVNTSRYHLASPAFHTILSLIVWTVSTEFYSLQVSPLPITLLNELFLPALHCASLFMCCSGFLIFSFLHKLPLRTPSLTLQRLTSACTRGQLHCLELLT